MQSSPIPALDPAPIPGPPWLFHLLWIVTFVLHLVFVNMVVGGTLLGALSLVGPGRLERRAIAPLFTEVNSWAISLAITFGIAPLLFLQVLYGRFFYSATILVAWGWLSMLGLLTVAYYLNYVAKFRYRAGKTAGPVVAAEALLFLAIAATQVAVNLLHVQPERWATVAASAWGVLLDRAFLPRFLHFVLAGVALSGATLAWVGTHRGTRRGVREAAQDEARIMARYGARAAVVATALQVVDGLWLLFALPERVLKGLLSGGAATLLPLATGLVAGLILLVLLAAVTDPLAQAGRVKGSVGLIAAAMIGMVVTRHQVRDLYLAPSRADESLAASPQWDVFVLFLVAFLLCLGLAAYSVLRATAYRPQPGEETA